MELGHFYVSEFEEIGDAVCAIFHAGEDENPLELGLLKEREQQGVFEMSRDLVDALGNGVRRVGALADLHHFWVVLKPAGERLDFLRERGGEHQGLSATR